MNIVYLTLEAPREGQASYVHVHEIISGFKKQGVDVILYQPDYVKKDTSPSLIIRLLHSIWLQFKMWLHWKKGSVLYVRAHYLAFPSAVFAFLFKIPIIHEINGPYEDVFVTYPSLNKFKRVLIPMQRWQYKIGSGLIAVTKELQIWANKQADRADCAFISNGANTDIFKPGLTKPDDAPNRYVVFFGGLTRWHGVDIMLDAVNSKFWPSDVKLLIIGDGQCSEMVENATKLNDKIVFLGRRKYQSVPAYVCNALAGLVIINNPEKRSSTGVLPLKLYETLSCGIPAIVTDLPGQSELIKDNQCGFVISQDNAGELAQTVSDIDKNPKSLVGMGQTARSLILKEHSWFKRSEDTLIHIKKVIGKC